MTRADKLRSMTDEQLADLISACGIDGQVGFCQDLPECQDGNATAEDCKRCMLKWLRSPAEGEEEET